MSRRARWFAPRFPALVERLLATARKHGHYPQLVAHWANREPGLRELYTCRVCNSRAWLDYYPPLRLPAAGRTVYGPMISTKCCKNDSNFQGVEDVQLN
jgi:hypothetical protein